MKSTIQRLKKEVLHLTKKLKKSEGELRKSREGHSEAAAEAAHFWSLHVKAIIDYSRRKANFAKELEECKKRDRKSTRLNSSHSGESRMPSSA